MLRKIIDFSFKEAAPTNESQSEKTRSPTPAQAPQEDDEAEITTQLATRGQLYTWKPP